MVTATRRLRHAVLESYAEMQIGRGCAAWSTPFVLSWDQWLSQCWWEISAADSAPDAAFIVLNEDQEALLWKTVIQDAAKRGNGLELLQTSSLAKSATEAWRLLRSWNLDLADLSREGNLNADTQAFHAWAAEFSRRCAELGYVSPCELPTRIGEARSASGWSPRQPIKWLGFDVLTPAQQQLYRRLQDHGVCVTAENAVGNAGVASCQECRDPMHEIESAARWARRLLEHGTGGPVGVVFRDLRPVRADVERIFAAVLHPERRFDDDALTPKTFRLSLGRSLHRVPVIGDAMLILQSLRGPIPINVFSTLVRSPFIRGGVREQSERALFDAHLRRRSVDTMEFFELRRALRRSGIECPILAECLDRLVAFDARSPTTQSPAAWADLFSAWLLVWGWPGDRVVNSTEHQAMQAWSDALSRFSSLSLVMPRTGLSGALSNYFDILQTRVFQPLASPAQIQVLGMKESSGLMFEHMWVAGMSDEQWPPAPDPNPLLPYALQRRTGMPGTTAHGVLEAAEGVTRRLLGSARRIVVSHPRQSGEQLLNRSSLFAHLREAEGGCAGFSAFTGHAQQLCLDRPVLDRVLDTRAPAVGPEENVSGGVNLIRDQAACPFRAFARHRLRSESLLEFELGLTAAERGTATHQCLARIWSKLRDQSALLSFSADALADLIKTEVDAVLERAFGTRRGRFGRKIVGLESKRLIALIEEWMHIEREREPFRIVSVEGDIGWEVAGMKMTLRADRVDQSDDGTCIVIDYKTGRDAKIDHWFHQRPNDPQLPIYLLASSVSVDALALARLRRGDCSFQGLGADSRPPGIEAFAHSKFSDGRDWAGQRGRWREVVERLAAEFRDGNAEVDPRAPRDCRYCDVWAVCRVFESDQPMLGEDDDG